MSVNGAPEHSVLIVTSDFPPLAGTNTQRVQSFVRHLPAFGWRSTVLTQAIEDMDLIDSRDLARLPSDAGIVRARSPDPFRWYRRWKGVLPRDVADEQPESLRLAQDSSASARQNASELLKGPLRGASRIAKEILRKFWYVPDPLMPWGDAAARTGRALIAAGNFDCLLTSAPSYSSHVAGLKIKRQIDIPWVADFRDLWVGRPYRTDGRQDTLLESRVVAEADMIIVASPQWKAVFEKRYGPGIGRKMTTLTNGFEQRPERAQSSTRSAGSTMRLVYTGTMGAGEPVSAFLGALNLVINRHPELAGKLDLQLIGGGSEVDRINEIIAASPLRYCTRLLGVRPNDECLAAQAEADVLLLFLGEHHSQTLSGKSFEYMATGKPILAIIPEHGIQAELLREAGTAMIVAPSDTDGIVRALHALIEGDAAKPLRPNWDYIRQFDRRVLAEKLAGILLACAQGREASPRRGSRLAA